MINGRGTEYIHLHYASLCGRQKGGSVLNPKRIYEHAPLGVRAIRLIKLSNTINLLNFGGNVKL